MAIRSRLTLLLAVALALPLSLWSVATPAQAATCTVLGKGPIKQTTAGFSQQITVYSCLASEPYVTAAMHIHPNAGYQASHVTGCAMHIGISEDDVPDSVEWDPVPNCTAKARLGGPWDLGIPNAGGWAVRYLSGDHFHMTGYVNIQTGAGYYGTYPAASRFAFTL